VFSSLLAGMTTKLIVGAFLLTSAIGLYFYVQSIRAENARLIQNEQVLTDVIQSKEAEIDAKNKALDKQLKATEELSNEMQETQERVTELLELLGNGRLSKTAIAKPNLIEKKVNKANKEWNESIRTLTDPSQYE